MLVPDCVGILVVESGAADGRGVDGRTDGAELVFVLSSKRSRVSACVGINVGVKLDDNIVGTSSSTLISV